MSRDPLRPRGIRLRKPVTLDDRRYTELTLQPPTLDDVISAGENGADDLDRGVRIISLMARVPTAVAAELSDADKYRVGRAAAVLIRKAGF